MTQEQTNPTCPLPLAVALFIFMVTVLGLNVVFFGDTASDGPNQISLVLMSGVVLAIGVFGLKLSYQQLEREIFKSLQAAIPACFILFLIGSLISLWIVGGIVPGLIYYGLELIHPGLFLPISFLSCCVVSLSIGSSWSTMGTVGIALIGIGQVLGVPVSMSAGAIISGSYFGDKMSPLSDTTNMASAVSEVDLFVHIRYMLYTTIPAALISLVLFLIIGHFQVDSTSAGTESIALMQKTLNKFFNISPLIFIAPLLVFVLIIFRTPALAAIFVGCLAGLASCLFLQGEILIKLMDQMELKNSFSALMVIAHSGASFDIGNEQLNTLLNRGGMRSMLSTVWFILVAMFFGGALDAIGMIQTLTKSILRLASSAGSLVGSTIAVCFTVNITTCEQYLAIVIPGKMFKKSFKEKSLAPENLSRALEDGGTMTAALIPWNTGAVYATGVLGVSPLSYAPYCFFNILCPIISIFMSSMNYKITKIDKS